MAYKDKNLVFTADSIYFDYDGEKEFVMMEWERPLMEKHANYVCENGPPQVCRATCGNGLWRGFENVKECDDENTEVK